MLNALWANGMIDGKEVKAEAERIEQQFLESVDEVYGRITEDDVDLAENPFHAASTVYREGQPKLDQTAARLAQADKLLVLGDPI